MMKNMMEQIEETGLLGLALLRPRRGRTGA